jgi:hypothetical protein
MFLMAGDSAAAGFPQRHDLCNSCHPSAAGVPAAAGVPLWAVVHATAYFYAAAGVFHINSVPSAAGVPAAAGVFHIDIVPSAAGGQFFFILNFFYIDSSLQCLTDNRLAFSGMPI